MDQVPSAAGEVQHPSKALQTRSTGNLGTGAPLTRADGAQMNGETRHLASGSGDAGIAPRLLAEHDSSDVAFETAAIGSVPDSKPPLSPSTRPGSLATAAASSFEHRRHSLPLCPAQSTDSRIVPSLIALSQLAAFTDVFLSGLLIPLIPSILEHRTRVPHQQVQIWISVFVSASAGAFAAVSPLFPFLRRQGPVLYAVFFTGLGCVAAAFALLQLSSNLYVLIFARALQGLAGAATTTACSALLATAAALTGHAGTPAWLTPAIIQNAAMTAAPAVAGFLHDYVGINAVFYCAYALVALNVLLGLVTACLAPIRPAGSGVRADGLSATGIQARGYGTMPSAINEPELSSRPRRSSSPSSVSPTSSRSARPSRSGASAAFPGTVIWSPRLLVALYGYLVVGLLGSALQAVLPLFVKRQFHWSVSASGLMFIPLTAPAVLIGPLAGALSARVPKSARFLAAIGFLTCLPAFGYLGQLTEDTKPAHRAFLATLSGLSLAIGLCGDPLAREVTNAVSVFAGGAPWNAAAQAAGLLNLASAWGSLVGPLFAGPVSWVCGWETMAKSLALVGASTGVVLLLFLQGWIGSPDQAVRARRAEDGSDEESAPLLRNDYSAPGSYGYGEAYCGKKGDFHGYKAEPDITSPHSSKDRDRRRRSHRRHFSVDNFSIATTAASGSMDSGTSQVRFQAALETPVHEPAGGVPKRPQTGDSASMKKAERRYVMREDPHAPATDPLLAAGSLYVIDEERDAAKGGESERQRRRVVVFAEGTAPPELLERHRHHVVAINALDGTAHMVSNSTDNHSVHVMEETGEEQPEFSESTSRRYVVVVVEDEGDESR
ncbi:hypothetical protein VTK56DRAFT_2795 [Thermocarpiscus australiensis]